MTTFSISKVYIVESLPPRQYRSGHALYEILCPVVTDRSLLIEFHSPTSADAVRALLQTIASDAKKNGDLPLLHIECHGNDEFLEFSDGSTMLYGELYELLVPLNMATRMRLFVGIAACFGAYLARTLNPMDRSPFAVLMSPSTSVHPDELFRSFFTLYQALLSTLNGDDALAALQKETAAKKILELVDAMDYFKIAYARYLHQYCSEKAYWNRAKALRKKAAAERSINRSIQSFVAELRGKEQAYFNSARRKYFLLDLFPENDPLFPATHAELRAMYR